MEYSPEEIKQMYQSDGLLEINHLNKTTNKREWIVIGVYVIPGETLDAAAKRTFEDFCFNMGKKPEDFCGGKDGFHYTLIPKLGKENPKPPQNSPTP
jgi:hypothetical protein